MFEKLKKSFIYNFKVGVIIPAKEALSRALSRVTNGKNELLELQIESLNSMIRNKIEQGETSVVTDVTPILSLFLKEIKEEYTKNDYIVKIIGEDIIIKELPEETKYIWISWRASL